MENLKEKFDQAVSTFNSEYEKFESKGNKAAGVRARKALQEIKVLAQDIRKQITESSKA